MEAQSQINNQKQQKNKHLNKQKGFKKKLVVQDSDSQWSLSSIQEIQGQNLKQLIEEDNQLNGDHTKKNQIDSQQKIKKQFKVSFPQKPFIGQASQYTPFGKIVSHVGGLIIVQSIISQNKNIKNSSMLDPNQIVVDLDNWLFDKNKKIVGFVMDVLGKIDHPYYVVKCETQHQSEINNIFPIDSQIFYIEGSKILREQDISSIMSKTGMDAQNNKSQDQSDDQQNQEGQLKEGFQGDAYNSDGEGQNYKNYRQKITYKNSFKNYYQRNPQRRYQNQQGNYKRRFNYQEQQQQGENMMKGQYSADQRHHKNYHRSRTREHLKNRRQFQNNYNGNNFDSSRQHHGNRNPTSSNRIAKQMNNSYLNGMYNLYNQQMMHFQYGVPMNQNNRNHHGQQQRANYHNNHHNSQQTQFYQNNTHQQNNNFSYSQQIPMQNNQTQSQNQNNRPNFVVPHMFNPNQMTPQNHQNFNNYQNNQNNRQ